ncbi:MAG: OmpA family protein [Bacteroidota bacterium]
MRKPTLTLLLCLFGALSFAQQSGLAIQLAAFDRSVSYDYFQDIEGVFHTVDHNNIYRYYIGGFASLDAAKARATELKNSTSYRLQVVDLDALRERCKNSCGAPVDPTTIRSIFFDFDRSNLRNTSVAELDKLYRVLKQNPAYSAELSAHTDAHGSDAYNVALSQRRAQSARDYLVSRGIQPERIQTSTFGENQPIAKNALNDGKDTPTGRQFNRRVELRVLDASKNTVNQMVEPISVPDHLKS